MKTKFFAILMIMCMLVTGFSSVPVYAMDSDTEAVLTESEAATRASSNVVSVGYAEVKPFIREELFFENHTDYPQPNSENVINIPDVRTANDARVHRLIFKVWFAKDIDDRGIGNVKLTIYVTTSNNKTLTSNYVVTDKVVDGSGTSTEGQFFIEGVSMNDVVSVRFDASTAPGVTSNGNFRSIYVYKADVYCD